MATESIQSTNQMKEAQTVEFLKQKYKWDWNEKLNGSPFRIEIKKLKEQNKQNPSMKKSNNEFKHILKSKEKELLAEFQKKCNQAKTWINNAHNENNNNKNENQQIAAYNLKKEKIETIDQFWDELICKQTVFLQQQKIHRQKQQMNQLEKQTKELQQQLNALNNMKKNKNNNIKNENNKIQIQTETENNKIQNQNQNINKKKKKKKGKNQYKGLIGYFNRPQTQKKDKIVNKNENKNENNIKKDKIIQNSKANENNLQMYNKDDDTKEIINEVKVEQKSNEIPLNKDENIKKVKNNNKKGSMKGGFLKGNTGLYKDKKLDSELSVKEKNAKNYKQIEEMGLQDAVNNPLFTWEKPKDGGVTETDNKTTDPLTAYLNQQYEQAQTKD